jgi:hypothetical protein
VTSVVERAGRIVGVVVDEVAVEADLVIDAGGRVSRLSVPAGPDRTDLTELSGDTGMAYVTRTYRRQRGAGPGPMTTAIAWTGVFDGYQAYVFPHERGHFSVTVVRPTIDSQLNLLRDVDAFDAACRAIPGVAAWTDPTLAVPTGGVLVGGRLVNTYRTQRGRPGLVAVGDAVATTAPTAGRGVAMASMQIGALLQLMDANVECDTVAEPFGAWCDAWIRPWVDDHLANDGEAVRLWQGHDIDLSAPLTSTAVVSAIAAEPRIGQHVGGYLAMAELPSSLAPAEPLARQVYESGWRPPYSEGPTRDQLVDVLRDAVAVPDAG